MTEFFMGSRIRATMPLLAYVWVWHRSIRPLPSTVLLIGGGILMFGIFPLVKVIRNIEGAARLTVGTYFDAISELGNTAVLILSEMGGSMITIAWTLELVPSMRDFDWGLSYLYAVLTLVPNLFWDIHPTVAHGLLANWLVWEKVPEFAVTGGGYGYSFIAEAFLNFGWIGAPVALCVIGYLLSRFTLWANATNQPIRVAAVASFMSFFLIFARGESGSVIRTLVWYSLLPYGLAYFLTRVKTLYRKRQDTRT
jgi:oligosaccharide repeat unit polymerase